jgi:transcriptional regulator with XRE-family HTH domain
MLSPEKKTWFRQRVGRVHIPRIKKVRLSRGVGLRELARRAGVSTNTVRRTEAGYAAQSRVAVAFAEALGVDILDLMAPYSLSDSEVEELRRVFAGGKPEAFGRGDAESEEDEDLEM